MFAGNVKMPPRSVAFTIRELPDACLERIFAGVSLRERLKVLPLVCKAWNDILCRPSAAWQDLRFTLSQRSAEPLDFIRDRAVDDSVVRWFAKRGAAVQLLKLCDYERSNENEVERFFSLAMPYLAQSLHAVLLTGGTITDMRRPIAWVSRCMQLRHLHLEIGDFKTLRNHSSALHCLGLLPHLTTLELPLASDRYQCNCPDQVVPFAQQLTDLTQLTALVVYAEGLPSQLTNLGSLRKLVAVGLQDRAVPEVLCKMTQLQWLELAWGDLDDWPDPVPGLSDLSSLSSLSHLSLHNSVLPELNPLSGLTTLVALRCGSCGVQRIPACITAFTRLEQLLLPGNPDVGVVPEEVFGMTQLRALHFGDFDPDADPEVSIDISPSITALHRLQSFIPGQMVRVRFPGDKRLHITIHWDLNCIHDPFNNTMDMCPVEVRYPCVKDVVERAGDIAQLVMFLAARVRSGGDDAAGGFFCSRYRD